jgi:hypothetical protein
MSGQGEPSAGVVERLRKAASVIYIAVDKPVADELAALLREAADLLTSRDAQGETPPQGPEDAGVRAYQSEPTMSAPPSTP